MTVTLYFSQKSLCANRKIESIYSVYCNKFRKVLNNAIESLYHRKLQTRINLLINFGLRLLNLYYQGTFRIVTSKNT